MVAASTAPYIIKQEKYHYLSAHVADGKLPEPIPAGTGIAEQGQERTGQARTLSMPQRQQRKRVTGVAGMYSQYKGDSSTEIGGTVE